MLNAEGAALPKIYLLLLVARCISLEYIPERAIQVRIYYFGRDCMWGFKHLPSAREKLNDHEAIVAANIEAYEIVNEESVSFFRVWNV
jgi:hypothetical protein